MSAPRVWLIGEANPYGHRPEYALYPEPPNSAGGRLCRLVLGMSTRDYLRSFERRNLCSTAWRMREARIEARRLSETIPDEDRVVLLGRRVWDAWFARLVNGVRAGGRGAVLSVPEWRPFVAEGWTLALPHPSGLSRAWNEPGSFARARECVAQLAPHLRPLLGAADAKSCNCVAFEYDGDSLTTCECGHSVEEHPRGRGPSAALRRYRAP